MDKQLLLSILAGESKKPVTKESFIDFTKTVTHDYENVAFYDAVVTFSTLYEKLYKKVHQSDCPMERLAHIIGKSTSKTEVSQSKEIRTSEHIDSTTKSASPSSTIKKGPKLSSSFFGNTSSADLIMKEEKTSKPVVLKSTQSSLLVDVFRKDSINSESDLQAFAETCCNLIIKTFIQEGSEQEINIHGGVRSKIVKSVKEVKIFHPIVFRYALTDVIVSLSTNAFPNYKKKVVLNNIGEGEMTVRFGLFLISLLAILAIVPLQLTIWKRDHDYLERLYLIIPLFAMFSGWFQHRERFCYIHGVVGSSNYSKRVRDSYIVYVQTEDSCARITARRYAFQLIFKCFISSILIMAIYMAIPPYSF